MSTAPKPTEKTIGGRRWVINRIPPREGLPLMARTVAFLGPALEGATGQAIRAAIGGMEDPDQSAGDLLRSLDFAAVARGVFAVRWQDPEFIALVRELLGHALCVEAQKATTGREAFDDPAAVGPFAGPDGYEALFAVLWAVIEGNFALPFFSRMRAGVVRLTATGTPPT